MGLFSRIENFLDAIVSRHAVAPGEGPGSAGAMLRAGRLPNGLFLTGRSLCGGLLLSFLREAPTQRRRCPTLTQSE